ncbi:MAG TPA: hypothetical protein PLV70_06170 [Flavobacteriales bacterium]|nr:hypothetical protein [Flavobacteriales bacterium]HRQ84683.1 hypothetical protein [Flavobacteriales bacterium]
MASAWACAQLFVRCCQVRNMVTGNCDLVQLLPCNAEEQPMPKVETEEKGLKASPVNR